MRMEIDLHQGEGGRSHRRNTGIESEEGSEMPTINGPLSPAGYNAPCHECRRDDANRNEDRHPFSGPKRCCRPSYLTYYRDNTHSPFVFTDVRRRKRGSMQAIDSSVRKYVVVDRNGAIPAVT